MMKLVIRNVETKISRIRYTLEKMVERDHPYAQKMKEYGVKPEHIKTARDMQLLPYTTKQDLQNHYPLGWLNVDRKHALCATSVIPTAWMTAEAHGLRRQNASILIATNAKSTGAGGPNHA